MTGTPSTAASSGPRPINRQAARGSLGAFTNEVRTPSQADQLIDEATASRADGASQITLTNQSLSSGRPELSNLAQGVDGRTCPDPLHIARLERNAVRYQVDLEDIVMGVV